MLLIAPDRAPKSSSSSREETGQPQTPERAKSSSVSSPVDENDPGGGTDIPEESDTDIGSDEEEPEALDDAEVRWRWRC